MTFAHPGWFLWLLLLPLLTGVAIVVSRQNRKRWHVFVSERLRPALLKRLPAWPLWLSFAFLLLSLALMLGALARPQADAGTRTEKTRGRNLLFVLDLSRSMRVTDVKPDRLAQAKAAIYEILESRPNDRAGVIGFAGTPYLFTPLTVDHNAVRETVGQLDETWIPTGGSNLTAALQLSVDTLKKTGVKQNALVVLSDGEEHEPGLAKAIAEAEKAGIYIFAIGVGTEDGDFVPSDQFSDGKLRDHRGNPVLSRLNPEVLRQVASETHGRFALAGSGADIPALVREGMAGMEEFELQGRQRKVYVEFYQWLLLPAVLCLMAAIFAGTRWRGIATGAAMLLVFMPHDVRAASTETISRQQLGKAFEAYRQSDFRTARSAYSGALLSKDPAVEANAHAGLGDTLFQLGWQSLAKEGETYGADPESPPNLEDFDKLVLAQLAKWKASNPPETGESEGFILFDDLIVNWTDAIRHFDSTLAHQPANSDVKHNRELVVRYLDRLRELLKDQSEQAQQQLPKPQPKSGQGKPEKQQPGDGGKGDEDQKGRQKPGEGPQGEQQGEKPDDGGEKKDDQGQGGDEKDDKDKKKNEGEQNDGGKPGETPEERARRILSEKSDVQKGPLGPGRFEPRRPEKDW
ncbi:MAG TPA: VWA domain-containing protein [Luteolibacter sp.]